MATVLLRCLFICLYALYVSADEIELEATSGVVLKMLREMVNETKADSLNLPANASSIRENITDTFSCENRVYGYYADVDNDCQIFHVCLPSQTPTGRNVTYRWSFICPSETVFNQEVLVCTRARDSIPCEDSPSYYDLNMEIGKIAEDKKEQPETDNKMENNEQTDKVDQPSNQEPEPPKDAETVTVKNQKRFPSRKKQNMVEKLVQEAVEEMNLMEAGVEVIEPEEERVEIQKPEATEEVDESKSEDSRLGAERSLRTGRHGWRGSYRYNSQ
ncbi:uncharacterized protein LOC119836461 [Zerene cesonia]|uniref:uncharacterized protein LOC119836461 n=1 Tax=Zerene cesonia TaxID=33412 RepID=UPI0018E593B0|nr:uncharacterized protein LOC119836461 [Zerene cesonia]